MANRERIKKSGKWETTDNPDEDIGHVCIYTVDKDDRNFKYCVYCNRVVYRSDEEIMHEYNLAVKRGLGGD